jgi:hypothetical protein
VLQRKEHDDLGKGGGESGAFSDITPGLSGVDWVISHQVQRGKDYIAIP